MISCMAWPSLITSTMDLITSKLIIITCSFVTLFLLFNSAKADHTGDAAALLAFKGNLNHTGSRLGSWNKGNISEVCRWAGVGCSGTGNNSSVISLSLVGFSLAGSIDYPKTLGNLSKLETLILRRNKLYGNLPADLANCTSLKNLQLQNNGFSGRLPADFTVWPLMEKLQISFNNFSEEIPTSLSNLTHLKSVFLDNNNFSGSIPSLIISPDGNFNVSDNHLSGSIPSSLSKFSNDSFTGNNLCGTPLPNCSSPPPPPQTVVSPTSPQPVSSSSKNLTAGAIAGIVIAVVAIAVVALLVCLLLLRRKSRKQDQAQGTEDMTANGIGSAPKELTFVGNAKQTFDLDDLLRASAEVLGKGSLGTVYKAIMVDGLVVSVKRLREVATEHEDAYKHVIEMLGALHHPNLVPVLAYFFAATETLLVSDYMPNGSLSSLLHGKKGTPLDWEARVDIAGAVARGLSYLHDEKVVHGNVKSSNVLLSRDGQARLIDYGLVQLMAPEPSSNLKPNGYTPPEASADLRKITYKGDVYAFGVLLLELLTGKSPIALHKDGINLPTWVQSNPREEEVLDTHILKYDYIQEEMIDLLHLALPCVSPSPDQRPPMAEIVKKIENLKREEGDDSS